MTDNDLPATGYWIDGPAGCPIGGPFDLWRQGYFLAHCEPPADTAKMYPSLSPALLVRVAQATTLECVSLAEVLARFGGAGADHELKLAYRYFSEWRKRAPFMPDSMQDIPLRPLRTSPEPFYEFIEDWRRNMRAD